MKRGMGRAAAAAARRPTSAQHPRQPLLMACVKTEIWFALIFGRMGLGSTKKPEKDPSTCDFQLEDPGYKLDTGIW